MTIHVALISRAKMGRVAFLVATADMAVPVSIKGPKEALKHPLLFVSETDAEVVDMTAF